ncbi:probable carboxylesterase 12 [Olea europaea subsp. europaea]|uniref:Probable carboxylesterase 12 n=1 Tax=Olea europaea subsp. europaea TaxID=158383 RepID=A0A8S0QJR3_OLEEU|nr:probable carboxylesterase 12 [Olea europaea subsp. europaea]
MDPNVTDLIHDFPLIFRIHKNGKIERYSVTHFVPPSHDPTTDVESKDVVISPEKPISARLFLPKNATPNRKLPVFIYIHGGGFSIESAFSPTYHNYLNTLIAEAKAIAVSIEYRLAPEHAIPACYDDCWEAIKWVELHVSGQGPDPWLNEFANFDRVFLAGDSAGANIAHNMAIRAGLGESCSGIKIDGLILVHPFFGNDEPDKLWSFICPETTGLTDPRLNPAADLDSLLKLGCNKVLVCTAAKDFLRGRGLHYYETVKKINWKGEIEILDIDEEGHVFHLFNPMSENAVLLMKKIVDFMKHYGD